MTFIGWRKLINIMINMSLNSKSIYTFVSPTKILSYLQLYFYDTDHEIENRLQNCPKLDQHILCILLNILQVNPYCSFFRHLKDIPNLEYKKTCIRSDPQLDQRLYNVPSISQVAVIWLGYNSEEHEPRNIVLIIK